MYRGQLEYLLRFQSTLPRRERQHPPFCKSKRGSISIHAPAKGATIFKIIKNTDCFYFNPRSREGSDRGRQRLSIKLYNFNPRSREGSDLLVLRVLTNHKLFQSTLPRRERQHLLTSFRLQYGYSLFHLTNKI